MKRYSRKCVVKIYQSVPSEPELLGTTGFFFFFFLLLTELDLTVELLGRTMVPFCNSSDWPIF